MAIFHYSAQMIKRSAGRSAVAAAAYRAGERIEDERTGLIHDYTKKSGIEHTEIMAPANAPEWVYNRSELWNHVEAAERRKDAQTAREINIALPKELNYEQNLELIHRYVQENFVDRGMIADMAIHYNKDNPHAHIMLTTREITSKGFGLKNREWNPDFANSNNNTFVKNSDKYVDWRASWQDLTNRALENAGFTERIDHRSLADQGLEQIPTIHEGPHVRSMEAKGIETDKGNLNRSIKEINQEMEDIKRQELINLAEYRQVKKEYENEIEGWKYYNSRERGAVEKAQEVLGDKPVTFENMDTYLKQIKYKQNENTDPTAKEMLVDQEKVLKRAFAALRSVELKEFTAENAEWKGAAYLEYNEMQSIKKTGLSNDISITPERIQGAQTQITETIDETRQALAAYRKGIKTLQDGRRAFDNYKDIQKQIGELDTTGNRLRGLIINRSERDARREHLDQLRNRADVFKGIMSRTGITNQAEYDSIVSRLSILKDNESRLSGVLDDYMDRQISINRALQAINSATVREQATQQLANNFKGQINLGKEDLLYLGEKVGKIAGELGFRDRYTNIRYLPEPIQKELHELSNWVLSRPGIKKTVDQYLDTQRELIEKQYRNIPRQSAADKAVNKAYNSLRDRVAQELKGQAVLILNNNYKRPMVGQWQSNLGSIALKAISSSIQKENIRSYVQGQKLFVNKAKDHTINHKEEGLDRDR